MASRVWLRIFLVTLGVLLMTARGMAADLATELKGLDTTSFTKKETGNRCDFCNG